MYKYMPRDFPPEKYLTLGEAMAEFYNLLEKCRRKEVNILFLDKAKNDLLFSIKHRVVERTLSLEQAEELRVYFGGLYNDIY